MNTIMPPPIDGGKRCPELGALVDVLYGTAPIRDIDRELDHLDECPVCAGRFEVMTLLAARRDDALAALRRMEGGR